MSTIRTVRYILAASVALASAAVVSAQTTTVRKESKSSSTSSSSSHISSKSSSGGVSVETVNGQAKVTWQGKQVFAGPVKGHPTARSSSENGKETATVLDGDRVLWESHPGAAKQLGSSAAPTVGADQQKLLKEHQQAVEGQRKLIEQQTREFQSRGAQGVTSSQSGGSSGGSSSGKSGGFSSGSGTANGGGRGFSSGSSSGSTNVTVPNNLPRSR